MQKGISLPLFVGNLLKLRHLFGMLVLLLLAPFPGPVHAESTWTHGWVKRIVHGADLQDIDKRECVKILTHDEIIAHDFVVVGYGGFRGRHYITVIAPNGVSLSLGESVWVDRKCSAPLRTSAPSRE